MKVPFLDVCHDVTRTAKKIPQLDYLREGTYRIFDQGKDYCAGYWNSDEGLVNDGPYIVFGDHTRIYKYVEGPCFIGADGVKLLKVMNREFLPKYVYYAMLANPIENHGYNRHFKFLKETSILLTDWHVQERIVKELDILSALLEEKNLQLNLLDEAVKTKYEELFGDPVLNDRNWPTEKLGICCPIKSNSGNIPTCDDGYVWLLNLDAVEPNTGRVLFMNYVYPESIGTSTIAFSKNNVLYSKLRPYLNKVVLPCESGYATSEMIPLLPGEKIDQVFLLYLLRSDNFVAYINSKSGGARMPRVSMDVLKAFPVIEPPLNIQESFKQFVSSVETAKKLIQHQIGDIQELFESRMDVYFCSKT